MTPGLPGSLRSSGYFRDHRGGHLGTHRARLCLRQNGGGGSADAVRDAVVVILFMESYGKFEAPQPQK